MNENVLSWCALFVTAALVGCGSQGDPGSAGAPGEIGASGPSGASGQQGPEGAAGSAGPTGSAGPAGPPGSAGDGGSATIDASAFIDNGTAPETASFDVTGNGVVGGVLRIGTASLFASPPTGTTLLSGNGAGANFFALDDGARQLTVGVNSTGGVVSSGVAPLNVSSVEGVQVSSTQGNITVQAPLGNINVVTTDGNMILQSSDGTIALDSNIGTVTVSAGGTTALKAQPEMTSVSGIAVDVTASDVMTLSAASVLQVTAPDALFSGNVHVGLALVDTASGGCKPSGNSFVCSCPAGTYVLSGGASAGGGGLVRESQPVGLTAWRATCAIIAGTLTADVPCAYASATCARIAP